MIDTSEYLNTLASTVKVAELHRSKVEINNGVVTVSVFSINSFDFIPAKENKESIKEILKSPDIFYIGNKKEQHNSYIKDEFLPGFLSRVFGGNSDIGTFIVNMKELDFIPSLTIATVSEDFLSKVQIDDKSECIPYFLAPTIKLTGKDYAPLESIVDENNIVDLENVESFSIYIYLFYSDKTGKLVNYQY